MGSGRRMLLTAVKQRCSRGITQWARSGRIDMARSGRIDPSIPQSSRRGRITDLSTPHLCSQIRDLSTAVKQWNGTPQWPAKKVRFFKNRFTRRRLNHVRYRVDVAGLLCTDSLVKNIGQTIKVDDLRGKTIVLFIVPLDSFSVRMHGMDLTTPVAGDTWDMIDAYYELLRVGSAVEFVFVPVRLHPHGFLNQGFLSEEAVYSHFFAILPFPAIPFSGAQTVEGPTVQTFSLDSYLLNDDDDGYMPYWVVIDPTDRVVATRYLHHGLFKLFGGGELHPLSEDRIWVLEASYGRETRLQRIRKWEQLLASDASDFLLSSNGDKVPISSLKGKLVGLYFCENVPHPPRMQAIKKVYEKAQSRGFDFEIVQITFHYHPFNAKHIGIYPTVQQCREDVSWLTLPFKDPSCRKLQRILHCLEEEGDHWVGDFKVTEQWIGDSLVLIHPDHSSELPFELSGAEILERWGIEGYPFTRPSLQDAEYELQKRELSVQSLFPPGERLLRYVGDGSDLVDAAAQLSGKRVLVLFCPHSGGHCACAKFGGRCDCGGKFVSMLKSEYQAQLEGNVEEERNFEVVYVSTGGDVASFEEFTKDMPWLVQTTPQPDWKLFFKLFKVSVSLPCAAAFNEQGELITKAGHLLDMCHLQFPFVDPDLKKYIKVEVEAMCDVSFRDPCV